MEHVYGVDVDFNTIALMGTHQTAELPKLNMSRDTIDTFLFIVRSLRCLWVLHQILGMWKSSRKMLLRSTY